ncbi:MAG TPA: aminotransferase class I/II-fold pyridoxal phosphate-dependent enzyme [Acidimicrobiales bacterium]|nr:aminotransferase class I/II-fold pyridoxal phosphate-dependent enzyme [Acidimicrobiales bacterium]
MPTGVAATGSGGPKPLRRTDDRWLDRWLETCSELARLQYSHPMVDAVVDEIDGRMIRVGDQWLSDFASCNYLGFDLDREIIEAIPPYLDRWGTHPSWSRLLGSPVLYEEIEGRLSELLGVEDTLVLPTITLIHQSVIPVLVGGGSIFLDGRAHKTIYDGAMAARSHGATIYRFRHDDPEDLERQLRETHGSPKVICTDGVNSMTGNAPPLAELSHLARMYDALLYVDDAHGFGVIGERGDDELCSYGKRGNSIVRHLGESYENIVLVGGLSKAYSSLLAFIACPTDLKNVLKVAAPPYLYSGPSPVASLATVIEGLKVNEKRGDVLRARMHASTWRILEGLDDLGIYTPNTSGYPVVEVPLSRHEDIDEVGHFLFRNGIYVTMAAYPLVPMNEVGFRMQITAANTEEQVEHLISVIGWLAERFPLRTDVPSLRVLER